MPTTLRSFTEGVLTPDRINRTDSAARTPGVAAIFEASVAGNTRALVNGPDTSEGTTQASAWKTATLWRISSPKLAPTPLINNVIANTNPAASTPMMKRRRRHCRSRKLTNSTASERNSGRDVRAFSSLSRSPGARRTVVDRAGTERRSFGSSPGAAVPSCP